MVSFACSRYASSNWIPLIVGGRSWEVRVKGNLTRRADNSRVNTSPVTSVTPIVRLRHGCSHRIVIPNQDADQDIVRCRWAEAAQSECAGVCRTFPGATLDEVKTHGQNVVSWSFSFTTYMKTYNNFIINFIVIINLDMSLSFVTVLLAISFFRTTASSRTLLIELQAGML